MLITKAYDPRNVWVGPSNGPSDYPQTTFDGTKVVFESEATNLSDVGNTRRNAFVWEKDRQYSWQLPQKATGNPYKNGGTYRPDISGDGSVVVFQSAATDMHPKATNGYVQIFAHRLDGSTNIELISQDRNGAQGADDSEKPILGGTGAKVLYSTRARNIKIHAADHPDWRLWAAILAERANPTSYEDLSFDYQTSLYRQARGHDLSPDETCVLVGRQLVDSSQPYWGSIRNLRAGQDRRVTLPPGSTGPYPLDQGKIINENREVAWWSGDDSVLGIRYARFHITAPMVTVEPATYTGSPVVPKVTVMNAGSHVDYTKYAVTASDNVDAGDTAIITVKGVGFWLGEVRKYFTIKPANITFVSVTEIPTQSWTGAPLTPEPTIRFEGKTLVKDRDYTLTHSTNTAPGTGWVEITGKGNFTGSRSRSFKILATHTIAGPTQLDTSAEIARAAFPSGATTAIIAKGDHWADALAGGPLAAVKDAPILLAIGDSLAPSVKAALQTLGVESAIILGGERAIRPGIVTEIEGMGITTRRLSGTTHYETADKIANEVIATHMASDPLWKGTALFASGHAPFDALSASPLAVKSESPIFLVDRSADSLTPMVTKWRLRISRSIALGGTAVIPETLYSQMPGTKLRWMGTNWWDTSITIAQNCVASEGMKWDGLAIARGDKPYDALAGGVLQGGRGSVLLLSKQTELPQPTFDVLRAQRSRINNITFLGGEKALYPAVRTSVNQALGG